MFVQKTKPFLFLGTFYVLLSFLLRIVFVFHPINTETFSFLETARVSLVGLLSDILVFTIASSFLAVYLLFLSDHKYEKPYGYIILACMTVAVLYILAPNNIFKQYGGSVAEIVLAFMGLKTLLFALMLFLPQQRKKIRSVLYFSTLFLYVLLMIFNAVSEYFFFNEFGVRYNFIAVDYLIYTNEVIGNIMESYPIVPLFTVMVLTAVAITWWIHRKSNHLLQSLPDLKQKLGLLLVFILLLGSSIFRVTKIELQQGNVFEKEIASNGMMKFYDAFTNKTLDYEKFYPTVDKNLAENTLLSSLQAPQLRHKVVADSPKELHKNVVLISIESLSADFLKLYGNAQSITPFLDETAQKSFLFTNLYATGNRTVRGLEALTLCIPPTAGESVIKREGENKNKFTTGSVFLSKGYTVKFLYGGYSYFDNMKDFFAGNGYQIVDRDNFKPDEISFANVWGVCDEDMAKKAVSEMNKDAQTGKPFFYHWMTVSNHRPFTYPKGKIDIPEDAKSREGGVKYTDYSLRKFFEMAQKQPWFSNTVFVIVADHCASSAGKTELPLDKYRIPGMIYAPGFVQPYKFPSLASQIDVMPTLMGMLNFSYSSKFLGTDVRSKDYQPRAYIATYQDLGYIKDNYLTVISPVKKVKQYRLSQQPSRTLSKEFNPLYNEEPVKTANNGLLKTVISAYQSTSLWVKNRSLDK